MRQAGFCLHFVPAASIFPTQSFWPLTEDPVMFRVLAAGATALLLLVSAAHVYAGGEELLNKKGTLKEKDPGYQPGEGVDKLGDPSAPIIFKIITDNPHQVFKLKLKKGDKVVISLKSDDFDSVVVVESSKKK